MREQVYTDPRPKEHFDRFHERARTREPDCGVRGDARPHVAVRVHRFCARARSRPRHVPSAGPVILAPNHFSFMDHFLVGCYLRRKIRFMAKSQLFKPPAQWVYTHGGVFPVRRGARDEETFITAKSLLSRGAAVQMYPEGGRSRNGAISAKAKRGIGRLALETGVPVVPIAVFGSSRVRNWKRLRFPKITVQYGAPMAGNGSPTPPRSSSRPSPTRCWRRSSCCTRGWRRRAARACCAASASNAARRAAPANERAAPPRPKRRRGWRPAREPLRARRRRPRRERPRDVPARCLRRPTSLRTCRR